MSHQHFPNQALHNLQASVPSFGVGVMAQPIEKWKRLPWENSSPAEMFCLLVDHWEKLSAFSEPLFNNVGAVIEFVFHSNLAEGAEVDEGATRRLIHDAVGTQPLSEAQPMLIA